MKDMADKYIYITVCFYLNQQEAYLSGWDKDLHYSMFLFKLIYLITHFLTETQIYITVCFYLNLAFQLEDLH